jgi:hypothetical protein
MMRPPRLGPLGCWIWSKLSRSRKPGCGRQRRGRAKPKDARRIARQPCCARRRSTGESLPPFRGGQRRPRRELRTWSGSYPARGRWPRSQCCRWPRARLAQRPTRSWRPRRAASRRGASWGVGDSALSTAESGEGRRWPSSGSTRFITPPQPTPTLIFTCLVERFTCRVRV